ncbi:MAG: acyl-CoA reductase [Verrucomicrobiae bacterium]|nr:acyl-CoA reductase [Verrucomicrobiae bacterium]
MNTLERAQLLEQTLRTFPQMGMITAGDLLALVEKELGHREALDGFFEYARSGGLTIRSRAIPPASIIHICAGTLANPGILSLCFGLLLGSRNHVKLPSAGCPELERFLRELPASLQAMVEAGPGPFDYSAAGAVIVYGSDETVAAIRRQVPARTPFLAHGHRLSYGIVFREAATATTAHCAAWDASAYDQQGCLSPHDIYVQEGGELSPAQFAAAVAKAMQTVHEGGRCPGLSEKRSLGESAAILQVRSAYRFRAANDPRVVLWESPGSDAWTVIHEEDPQFATSCLNRVLFIKPFRDPVEIVAATEWVRPLVSTVGTAPVEKLSPDLQRQLGAARICPLGHMQSPPLLRHHDARPHLADLVTWLDREE